jgi:hypothetical protein
MHKSGSVETVARDGIVRFSRWIFSGYSTSDTKIKCLKWKSSELSNATTTSCCTVVKLIWCLWQLICYSSDHYESRDKCFWLFFFTITGSSLGGASYIHPCRSEQVQPFLPAAHVTTSKGTGLVHSAPAHGPEDYLVALEHSIRIVSRSTRLIDLCFREFRLVLFLEYLKAIESSTNWLQPKNGSPVVGLLPLSLWMGCVCQHFFQWWTRVSEHFQWKEGLSWVGENSHWFPQAL